MASRSWLDDIDDEFCRCPICKQLFDKPKYLPCLHRYCSLCLKLLIEGHQGSLQCPECDEEFKVPDDGVDGLKNDVFMEEIIRYIQLLQLLKSDQTHVCCSCLKSLRVTAFCFKCHDFLCGDCEQDHLTNKYLTEHKLHTFPMEYTNLHKVNLAKLFAVTESLCCTVHPQKSFLKCCKDCNNTLICMDCVCATHNGHIIRDVKYVAEMKIKELAEQFNSLTTYKDYVYNIPGRIDRTTEMLKCNVKKVSEKLLLNYEKEVKKRKERIKEIEAQDQLAKAAANDIDSLDFPDLKNEMEEEIKKIREKYDKLLDEKRNEMKNKVLAEFNGKYGSELSELIEELKIMEKEYESFSKLLRTQQNEHYASILEISKYTEINIKRYEFVEGFMDSVLSSQSYWAAVYCIPDILTAIKSLSEKLKKEFPKLETLSHVSLTSWPASFIYRHSETKCPSIAENYVPVVGICRYSQTQPEGAEVYGYDDRKIGRVIVIRDPRDQNRSAKDYLEGGNCIYMRVEDFQTQRGRKYNGSYNCDVLSSDKIIISTLSGVLNVYDVSDISNIKKEELTLTISDKSRNVRSNCFAVDHVNKNIYVVGGPKCVYVFDENVKYLHTLTLPLPISAQDMAFEGEYIIVCHTSCESNNNPRYGVCAFHCLDGALMFEFEKPQSILDVINAPISVCTDGKGFIYIMWNNYGRNKTYIAQYSRFGHYLLKTTKLDLNAIRLRITNTTYGETLLVFTNNKIHKYSLRR